MITRQAIQRLIKEGKPVHTVTRDFGPKRSDGLGGIQKEHYATKAQADRELASHKKYWSESGVKVEQGTRPAAELADVWFPLV